MTDKTDELAAKLNAFLLTAFRDGQVYASTDNPKVLVTLEAQYLTHQPKMGKRLAKALRAVMEQEDEPPASRIDKK